MPFSTLSVASATTPTVISTFFSHYLNPKSVAGTPSVHISYHEGLALIRQFLTYASHHTVEEIQAFTSQPVPYPTWVRVEEATINAECIERAAGILVEQLGEKIVKEKVGGRKWWQWREKELKAEWIEMRRDYDRRVLMSGMAGSKKRKNKNAGEGEEAEVEGARSKESEGSGGKTEGNESRTMFYVHGGAYFFSSVNVHRYQMQRHARKLKGRVFAPCYRLAPQFPFPCALLDVLASYIYLIQLQDPSTIVLAGDSAGGGMVLSLLTILRDNNLPLPAGAVLISPWVDLCHSFPSVIQDDHRDYIPRHGFLSKPSAAWPPPNADDMAAIAQGGTPDATTATPKTKETNEDDAKGFTEEQSTILAVDSKPKKHSSVVIDEKLVTLQDQIHMYTTNEMIGHPLVSPCNQGSLGGLPPLLILTGGGEVLRDEQIYVAHKAANPKRYPPHPDYLKEDPRQRANLEKYPPTNVQLQVYDDCCHVTTTLSFTKPARLMYRAITNFSLWAISNATPTPVPTARTPNISSVSAAVAAPPNPQPTANHHNNHNNPTRKSKGPPTLGRITKDYSPPPLFTNHMIRQRIDLQGTIYPLAPEDELTGCTVPPEEVGVIKPEPVRRWMEGKRKWDVKYAASKRAVQRARAKELMISGGLGEEEGWSEGERPPPSALVGRSGKKGRKGGKAKEEKEKESFAVKFWECVGSRHDKVEVEKSAEKEM